MYVLYVKTMRAQANLELDARNPHLGHFLAFHVVFRKKLANIICLHHPFGFSTRVQEFLDAPLERYDKNIGGRSGQRLFLIGS